MTRMTLDLWLRSSNKLYILFAFHFLIIMFLLSYWHDQKTGIVFTVSYILLKINLGTPKLVCPKSVYQPKSTLCSRYQMRTIHIFREYQVTVKSNERDIWKRYLQHVRYWTYKNWIFYPYQSNQNICIYKLNLLNIFI